MAAVPVDKLFDDYVQAVLTQARTAFVEVLADSTGMSLASGECPWCPPRGGDRCGNPVSSGTFSRVPQRREAGHRGSRGRGGTGG